MLTHEDIKRLAIVRERLLKLARELSELAVKDGEEMFRDVMFLGDTAHIRVHHSGEVVLSLRID